MCFRPPSIDPEDVTCAKCGATNPPSNTVCEACGEEVRSQAMSRGAPVGPPPTGASNAPKIPKVPKVPGGPTPPPPDKGGTPKVPSVTSDK